MKRVTEIEAVDLDCGYNYGLMNARVGDAARTFSCYEDGQRGDRTRPRKRGGQVRNFWYKGKCVRSPEVRELLLAYGDLELECSENLEWSLAVYHRAGQLHCRLLKPRFCVLTES